MGIFQRVRKFIKEEPEDTPLPDTLAKAVQNPAGLLEHLDALRKHLLRGVLVLMLTTGASFFYAEKIMELLAAPIGGVSQLRAIAVTEPIGVFMRVSLLSGFSLALPYIAFEMWLFMGPGISRRSRFLGLFAIPVVVLFFLGGMLFAYYVMLPVALPFLINFLDIPNQPTPSSYFGFATSLLFWIGVAFEFPLVIFLLAGLGLVNARLLIDQWRLAIVIISILSALITPTVDPVNMALVMGPMIVLYFLSIILAFVAQRGHTEA